MRKNDCHTDATEAGFQEYIKGKSLPPCRCGWEGPNHAPECDHANRIEDLWEMYNEHLFEADPDI